MIDDPEVLEDIVHELNSKASSLRSGGDLLRKAAPADRDKLVRVMAKHAESLARFLNESLKNGAGA